MLKRMKNKKYILAFILLVPLLASFAACSGRKIESSLKQAEELKGTRKFNEALEIYKLIITNYPNDNRTAVAHVRLGDLYQFTFDDIENALTSYSKVIEKWPFSAVASDAAVKKAEIYKNKDNLRKAISEYEWVLKHFPGHERKTELMLQIAEAYLNLSDPYQASIELEKILKNEDLKPEIYPEVLFSLAESYLFLGKYSEALEILAKIESEYPTVPFILEVRLRMVECMEELNMREEGIALQRKMMKLHPDSEIVKKKFEGLIRRGDKSEKPEGERFEIRDQALKVKGEKSKS